MIRVELKANRDENRETDEKGTEMNTLKMTEAKEKKMNEIEDMSMEVIQQALSDQISADGDNVKIAVKMMGVVAKNRQTVLHRDAVEFGMAQFIADEVGMKKYLAATNPQIQKAIGSSK